MRASSDTAVRGSSIDSMPQRALGRVPGLGHEAEASDQRAHRHRHVDEEHRAPAPAERPVYPSQPSRAMVLPGQKVIGAGLDEQLFEHRVPRDFWVRTSVPSFLGWQAAAGAALEPFVRHPPRGPLEYELLISRGSGYSGAGATAPADHDWKAQVERHGLGWLCGRSARLVEPDGSHTAWPGSCAGSGSSREVPSTAISWMAGCFP